jgi:glycerol-3-phosphate dehydrogenase subunit B
MNGFGARTLSYDAVVIGAGVAGLTAACSLAESGARVCVLAKGVGSTHLAPATIDVLGYAPERVENPVGALPGFIEAHPEHPYALIGGPAVAPALERFVSRIERGPAPGYRYVGALEQNHLLPTAIGGVRPSALVPETMAAGDLRSPTPVCVVGIRVLRDFHASLCAANLRSAGIDARSVELDIAIGRPEANSLGLARRMDDPGFRGAFAAALLPLLRAGERVGVPAFLGLRDPRRAWSDLEHRLGRVVFEIPTLPPSVPGMRLYNALVIALRSAGGRIVLGAEVSGGERDGDRVVALRARTSGRDTIYRASSVVLATGGVHSGAIELTPDWQARETVLGLPLRGVPAAGEPRFLPDYFGPQPMARVGVAVAPSLAADGAENVFVAGAGLPGAEPWREGSGEGIALGSGERVAAAVREREGAAAATA